MNSSPRDLRAATAATAAIALAALAGCAAGPATAHVGSAVAVAGSSSSSGSPVPSSATATPTHAVPTPAPGLSPPHVPGLTWVPAGPAGAGRPAVYTALTDNGAVGLLWMDASRLRFRFVPGWKVPEGGPRLPADTRPSTWVSRMVAAFNGGFMLKDHIGGYYYAGRTVSALRAGLGTFTITSAGRIAVGAWGRDLRLTAHTVVVRQNLPLLVDGFRARTSPSDTPSTWGVANGGLWTANRSALGQLADGSVVYAFGANVRPSEMAAAMVAVRARVAMVLDMNKSWPGGFTYHHSRGKVVGRGIQRGIWHQPSVYFAPFTKDFVVAQWP